MEHPTTLSSEEGIALPPREVACDIHGVTSWTNLGMRSKGVPFTAIAEAGAPRPTARFVVVEREQGFTTSRPYEALRGDDVLPAHSVEGRRLTSEQGGPVRVLVPKRYFYKSAKW